MNKKTDLEKVAVQVKRTLTAQFHVFSHMIAYETYRNQTCGAEGRQYAYYTDESFNKRFFPALKQREPQFAFHFQ